MSSTEVKKENTKLKVKATAAWEWFKSAAWLQVLLIVGLVVGIVVSIPYIVQGITDLVNRNTSHFYESKEITFDDFQRMIDGEDPSRADGVVGTGMKDTDPNLPDEYKDLVSEDLEGFVVMFVKANCDNCSSIQSYLETWFNQFNNEDGINNRLRLFTIDVSFVPDDSSKSTEAEGSANNYENENITLEQQNEMMSYMKDTYLNQDDAHRVSEVTESTFEMDLTSPSGSGTIPTPTFVLYTKNKDEEKYDIANPTKVICGAIGDLNYTSQADMNSQMLDVFDFVVYSERAN